MILQKITVGFVIQNFDTQKNEFVEQEFIAGDEVTWEDNNNNNPGSSIDYSTDKYLPFDMKQPKRK